MYAALLEDIRREFPRFRLIRKDQSPGSRAIHYALLCITAGAQRGYLTAYHTTIGSRVYVTPDWDGLPEDVRIGVLRHERVHMRQFRRYTPPGMALLYLLVPFPFGLAWFRARFEQEAYEESIRTAAAFHGIPYVQRNIFREHILRQFTSGTYGWMWPYRRSLERWYDGVVARIPHDPQS